MNKLLKYKKQFVIAGVLVLLSVALLFVLFGNKDKQENPKSNVGKEKEISLEEEETEGGLKEQESEDEEETEEEFPFINSESDDKEPANNPSDAEKPDNTDNVDSSEQNPENKDDDGEQGNLDENTPDENSQKFTGFF